VAVGSLYQYFNNRKGLLAFTTALTVQLLTDVFATIRPFLLEMSLRDALCAYLSEGMKWGQTMQGLIQFYGRAAYTGDPALTETVIRPVAVAMRETMLEMLTAAQARGELRPGLDLEAAARAVNAWIIALGDSQMFPYLNTYFQVTDETVVFERALESVLSILGITSTFGRKRQAEKTRWRHGWRNTHRNRYAKMHVVKPIWQAQMILPI
jgi:AcrR family transcriptional regulator